MSIINTKTTDNATSQLDLRGVIPPLITPLTLDREIDVSSLRRLVRFQIEAGVHGLFVLGSSSEGPELTWDERGKVMDVVVEEADGRLPVLAGVGDTSTRRSLVLARQAASAGVDALVLTATFYHVPSQAEIADHFRAVRAAVDLPLVAYNIPQLVDVSLAVETIAGLAREGVIVGVKDSAPDLLAMRELVLATRDQERFRILTGQELLVDAALLAGAHGVVPGLGNVAPHEYVELYRACRDGRWDEARTIQERLVRLFDICYHGRPGASPSAAALSGFKSALRLRHVIETCEMTQPMRGLDEAGEQGVRGIMEELGFLPQGA